MKIDVKINLDFLDKGEIYFLNCLNEIVLVEVNSLKYEKKFYSRVMYSTSRIPNEYFFGYYPSWVFLSDLQKSYDLKRMTTLIEQKRGYSVIAALELLLVSFYFLNIEIVTDPYFTIGESFVCFSLSKKSRYTLFKEFSSIFRTSARYNEITIEESRGYY